MHLPYRAVELNLQAFIGDPMARNDAAGWQAYWESVLEGSRRLQVEHAAADPIGRWVVANAPTLCEEFDLDAAALRRRPDDHLAKAREGFEAVVADRDLSRPDHATGYDLLPVHLTALGRIDSVQFAFTDAVADANTLTTIDNATVVDAPERSVEPALVTYRCPAGHDATVRSTLPRTWTLETCGVPECTNEAVPDDAQTRARRVVRFSVETPGGALPCVATGQYVTDERMAELTGSTALHLTGIPRLVVDAATIEPVYEVLAVERAAP